MVFEAFSVSVAMYCLIQFYLQLKVDLAEHKPFLKVVCIKLVIFFSFWQSVRIPHFPLELNRPGLERLNMTKLTLVFSSS